MIDPDREDLWIHRVVSGAATAEDWNGIESAAAADTAVWERLAAAIRDERHLLQFTDRIAALAAKVELNIPAAAARPASRAVALSGWLTAAAITIFSFISVLTQKSSASQPSNARDPYAAEVVGELPRVLIETRAVEGGGFEVTYVRRVVERAIASGFDQLQINDAGQAVRVPISLAKLSDRTPF
ncbi:MAG: hypothetical protein HY286_08820 [Planctomycetes bacterium]|nr:hypothetical protein [Planctomycetota bacterium]